MSDARVSVPILEQEDVIRARQAGRQLAKDQGLGTADQTRFATVISELTRNALRYAGGGTCDILMSRQDGKLIITVQVRDEGPGIADVELALTPGFSTGNGLGAGLPGVRRLMDRLTIDTRAGFTCVEASMIRRAP